MGDFNGFKVGDDIVFSHHSNIVPRIRGKRATITKVMFDCIHLSCDGERVYCYDPCHLIPCVSTRLRELML